MLNLITVDHPQTDGQTKRVNQVLEDMLRAYVSKKQSDWESYLPIIEFAYNSAKHVSTSFSPFILMYGFQPRSPVPVGLANEKIHQVKDFLQDHMDMSRVSQLSVCQAQDCYKKFADQKRRTVHFKEGDWVFLKVPENSTSLQTGSVSKLSLGFCGPFKILNKVEQVAYKLELPAQSKVHPIFHVSRVHKRLIGQERPVETSMLVEYTKPLILPHELERVLDYHMLRTCHQARKQALMKWKGCHPE